jgi:phage tail-like protein
MADEMPDPAAAAEAAAESAKDAAEGAAQAAIDQAKDMASDLADQAKDAAADALGLGGGNKPPPPPPPPPALGGTAPAASSRSSAASAKAHLPDPVGELRFQVSINDAVIGQFAEVSGLTVEYDIMEYQEGGEPRFVHKFRGGMKYPNLVLKRGVTYEDALLQWFFDRSDREHRGDVTLNLLGDDGKRARTWSFASAFPVKWSGPSFNAKSTNVATETLEIAHQGLMAPGVHKNRPVPPSTTT